MATIFDATNNASQATATVYHPSVGMLPRLPPTLLDALVPGYSAFADTIATHFRVDVSFYVSLMALILAMNAVWGYVVVHLTRGFVKSVCSTVEIDGKDEMHTQVLRWMSQHQLMKSLRRIKAQTRGRRYSWDDEDDFDNDEIFDDEVAIFNFRQWNATQPPKYLPQDSSGWFFHKSKLFRIVQNTESVPSSYGVARIQKQIYITCLWRSTRPLKEFLEEVRQTCTDKQTNQTAILRPNMKAMQTGEGDWDCVSVRPSRPMSTVVLEDTSKAKILMDMNEFLQPRMASWYANRGVPYRRGYLFYGPPGTGKTSMSFSLAGIFGLSIYCLSLSETMLSEEALIALFSQLPQRCVVLLEDIDCAGVARQKAKAKKKKAKSLEPGKSETATVGEAPAEADEASKETSSTTSISVSGLLNAIDGVASSEGRVLIMTTNYRERLDDALVRPGRADLQIHFGLASTQQIRELFVRMYSPDETNMSKGPSSIQEVMPHIDFDSMAKDEEELLVEQTSIRVGMSGFKEVPKAQKPVKDGNLSKALADLADEFARILPGDTFSPAEVQGYLLTHKKRPRKAVSESRAWKDEMLAKKASKVEERSQDNKVSDAAEVKTTEAEEVREVSQTSAAVEVTTTKPQETSTKSEQVNKDTGAAENIEDEDLMAGMTSARSSTVNSVHESGSSSDSDQS